MLHFSTPRSHRTGFHFVKHLCAFGLLLAFFVSCTGGTTQTNCGDCKEGQTQCKSDGQGVLVCKRLKSTGCFSFTLLPCEAGEICRTEGDKSACLPAQGCPQGGCTQGSKRCQADKVEACQLDPASSCPVWSAEKTCAAGEICDPTTFLCILQSSCQAKDPQKEKRCVGQEIYWFDDCGKQASLLEICSQDLVCENAACIKPGCQAKEPQKEKRCVGTSIHWFDDCGKQGALVEACPAGFSCQNAACIDPGCQPQQPQKEKRCVGQEIYWFDDCGQQANLVEACPTGKVCQNAVCIDHGCQPQQPQKEKRCVGQEIFWFDDCGKQGALVEACPTGKVCQNAACIDPGCQPQQPQKEKRCVGNNVHWFDDCGKQGALVEACPTGTACQNAVCTPQGCQTTNPQHERRCVGTKVYWFDNCGKQGIEIETCFPPTLCQNGQCFDPCSTINQCAAGSARCQGNQIQYCTRNSQGCQIWDTPVACGTDQICQNAVCIPDPAKERKCSFSNPFSCSKDNECCLPSQTCRAVTGILKTCAPCAVNSDCPKIGGFIPTVCCSAGTSLARCEIECPAP